MARFYGGQKPIFDKSGCAVYVPVGTFQVQGHDNRPYARFSFFNASKTVVYKVKFYGESLYTPSSGAHRDKQCCPYSVTCYAWVNGARGDKKWAKGGSAVCVEPNNDNRKPYIRACFVDGNTSYAVKMYSQSLYVPSSGRNSGKNCYPVKVYAFPFSSGTGMQPYNRRRY